MQRYFIEDKLEINTKYILDKETSFHIFKVMRMKNDEQIILVDRDNIAYYATLINVDKEVEVLINERLKYSNEPKIKVTLVQGLIKSDKFEYLIQKSCELGVSKIIPFEAKRSIVKYKQERNKLDRYKKILKEASEQCHRSLIPEIVEPQKLDEICLIKADLKIIAYEENAHLQLHQQLKKSLADLNNINSICFVIGPEGGLSIEEVKMLEKHGFVRASLGPRILRTETAPLYCLSVVSYLSEL